MVIAADDSFLRSDGSPAPPKIWKIGLILYLQLKRKKNPVKLLNG